MKNIIIRFISILAVLGTLRYPITFLKHAYRHHYNLKVLVGTEYDVAAAAAWVIGVLIYLIFSLLRGAAIEKSKNILGGIISAYSIGAIVFAHQTALTAFNSNNRLLCRNTFILTAFFIILLIIDQRTKDREYSENVDVTVIAVVSIFYYGISSGVLRIISDNIFSSPGGGFGIYMLLCAAAGALCITRQRVFFSLTISLNMVNSLMYAAMLIGTIVFTENIGEALQSGIPALYVAYILIRCSLRLQKEVQVKPSI
jgi:hypothetical protein